MAESRSDPARQTSSPDPFDAKAAEWDTKPLTRSLCDAVSKALKEDMLRPDWVVMDFGCGTGLLAQAISNCVQTVVGVDTSKGMIQAFQAKVDAQPGCNLHAVCAELVNEGSLHAANSPSNPFPERFDLVVSSMALHHIQDIPGLLRILVSHLQPGGRIALFDFKKSADSHRFHKPGHADGVHHHGGFTEEELCSYLSGAGLGDVRCRQVHTFQKAAGDDPAQMLEFGLLMASGSR